VFVQVARVEFAEVLEDVEFGGHFREIFPRRSFSPKFFGEKNEKGDRF